jgi:NAD+ synthase
MRVGIIKYNQEHHMNTAVIANSGGLDSAVTSALLSKAAKLSGDLGVPFKVISFGLPIYSNADHNARAKETTDKFSIQHFSIDGLNEVFDNYKNILNPISEELHFNEEEKKRAFGNVKARMRMIVNFFASTKAGTYVVSTDNLSELYMAFWTLMGDVGAFGPIQNIFKGLELPAIAYMLDVPERTLGAKPTDGLEIHQSLDDQEGGDSDAFKGVKYPELDALICQAVKDGLRLDSTQKVFVDVAKFSSIQSIPQETADFLINQMVSPVSVWKRTRGSIGSAISRDELGLKTVFEITNHL